MTSTPRGSPELVLSQGIPETTVNEQIRRTEGGAGRYPIADRVTAPPGSCSDGAQYIIIATATGAFTGKEGQIAQAVGTNAASGWHYRVLTAIDEGVLAYVQDEDAEYKWSGSAWATYGGGGYSPGGTDVAVADGGTGASTASGARTNLSVYSTTEVDTAVAAAVAGLSWKQAVRVATTANGTLATAYENGDTVDGVVLATGDRILIKNQSSGAENGIYVVAASGAPSRSTDADSGAELVNASCYVSEGTTNADTQWTCTTNATITPGSTSLAFAQLATGGAVGANPSATASDTANNGVATTFMRSDATPPVQKGSSSAFGIVKVDGTTITASGGVISAVGGGGGSSDLANHTLLGGF